MSVIMPYASKQGRLNFVRDREYAYYHPWVWRYEVKLLSCTKEEMQVTLFELLKILCADLLQSHLLVTPSAAQAVPEKRARLPIKYL
jgi:hypothetical protein